MDTPSITVQGTVGPVRASRPGWVWAEVHSGANCWTVHAPTPLEPGMVIEACGEPDTSGRVTLTHLAVHGPHNQDALRQYLASGILTGVGESVAGQIVDRYGDQALAVLHTDPGRVAREIPRTTPAKTAGWAETLARPTDRDWFLRFMAGHGLTHTLADQVYEHYGAQSEIVVRTDPYRIAREVDGVGFVTADRIAQATGLDARSPTRLQAALRYTLAQQIQHDGHCGLPVSSWIASTVLLVQGQNATVDLYPHVAALAESGAVVVEDEVAYPAALHRIEQELSERFAALAGRPFPYPIPWTEPVIDGRPLAGAQRDAVHLLTSHGCTVLTGPPGTGKTTIVRCVLDRLPAECRVALAAPTGHAAERLSESTAREAQTLHRLLGYKTAYTFQHDAANPLPYDLVLVDEVSMNDVYLMAALLRALGPRTALIMVGDADQIPSIGPGQVLADLIQSQAVPVATLTEPRRFGKGSGIAQAANAIRMGWLPKAYADGDYLFQQVVVPRRRGAPPEPGALSAATAEAIITWVTKTLPARGFDPAREVQVLAPLKAGAAGTDLLNKRIQQALNPGTGAWRVGDRVMHTRNDRDRALFNGAIGYVVEVRHDGLLVDFGGRTLSYHGRTQLRDLTLAYACTIHKFQGSEARAVVLPWISAHSVMLKRNIFYTAITRAREQVVVVGQTRAVHQALATLGGARHTRLRRLLAERIHGHHRVPDDDLLIPDYDPYYGP